jgi:SAM-dependent methyltransferase
MHMSIIDSAAWYDRNTQDYIDRTQDVDLEDTWDRFLVYVRDGGRILDAGCGSGRDSLAFIRRGYDAVPMDASVEMVRHASELTGRKALHLRHEEVEFEEAFDGVWSNASLLHVRHEDLPGVFRRYQRALVPGGVMFSSFKYGEGERVERERTFSHHNEETFRQLLSNLSGLSLHEMWIDHDRRPGREHERWLNTVLVKDLADTAANRP